MKYYIAFLIFIFTICTNVLIYAEQPDDQSNETNNSEHPVIINSGAAPIIQTKRTRIGTTRNSIVINPIIFSRRHTVHRRHNHLFKFI